MKMNCNRFESELDAQLAFLNEEWLISVDKDTMLERDKFENWTDEMRLRYGRWLFKPVAEGTKNVLDLQQARAVLDRVHNFLGICIRESLIKDAPFLKDGELEEASDLADDVWEVLQ